LNCIFDIKSCDNKVFTLNSSCFEKCNAIHHRQQAFQSHLKNCLQLELMHNIIEPCKEAFNDDEKQTKAVTLKTEKREM